MRDVIQCCDEHTTKSNVNVANTVESLKATEDMTISAQGIDEHSSESAIQTIHSLLARSVMF